MTLDEARAAVGQPVTHHATGVIELVTAQFVWVRYDGAAAAQPVHPNELTLTEPAPVDGSAHVGRGPVADAAPGTHGYQSAGSTGHDAS